MLYVLLTQETINKVAVCEVQYYLLGKETHQTHTDIVILRYMNEHIKIILSICIFILKKVPNLMYDTSFISNFWSLSNRQPELLML